MKKRFAIFLLLCFALAFLSVGCIEKTLLPTAKIWITNVSPMDFTASSTTSLTTISITCELETGVHANPVSYSTSYQTMLGQPLTGLGIPETPIPGKWSGNTIDVTITPFSQQLLDLLAVSPSQITPVLTTIKLTFRDDNGNIIVKEVYCRLF